LKLRSTDALNRALPNIERSGNCRLDRATKRQIVPDGDSHRRASGRWNRDDVTDGSVPIPAGGRKWKRSFAPTIRIEEAALQFSILIFQPVGQVCSDCGHW
jgi:hypothetical protein